MPVAPVLKTVAVKDQASDVIAAAAFCAESADDVCALTTNTECPILRVTRFYRKRRVDYDYSTCEPLQAGSKSHHKQSQESS